MNYSVFTSPPEGFQATVEAAGCYCTFGDTFLILKRHPSRPQGNTWGVPAGKLEVAETAEEAVIRELREEVGLDVSLDLLEIGPLYVQHPRVSYVYHMFYKNYTCLPELSLLMEENVEAAWLTIEEALKLPLIMAGKEALHYYKNFLERVVRA